MSTPRINNSEFRFCEILWENEPVSSTDLVKLCKEKDGDVLKDSLIEWKKICLAMWPLDFLTITKSGDCFLEKWSFNGKITLVKSSADESTIKN